MKKLSTYITALLLCCSLSITAQKDTLITSVINFSGDPQDLLTGLLIGSMLPDELASLIPTSVCPGDRLLITVDTTGGNYAADNFFIAEFTDDILGGLGGLIGGIGGGLGGFLGGGLGGFPGLPGGGLLPEPNTYYLGETPPGGRLIIDIIGGLITSLLDGLGAVLPGLIGGGIGGGVPAITGFPVDTTALALPTIGGTQSIIGIVPDDIPSSTTGYYMRIISSNPADTSVYYSGSFTVERAETPTITFWCRGDSTYITSSVESEYLWSNGSTNQSVFVKDGSHEVTVTNVGGCSASADTSIAANQILMECFGQTVLLTSAIETADTYSWSSGADENTTEMEDTETANQNITLITEGPYSCSTIFNAQCPDPVTTSYNHQDGTVATAPTIFTPNNDNVNDEFVINNADKNIKSISIFNVWGNKVFQSQDIIRPWDGFSTTGAECPSGTYFYVLEHYNTDQVDLLTKGFLTLVR